MWPAGAWVNFDRQDLRLSPGHHFDRRHQPWRDAVCNQIGETLFLHQYVGDSLDPLRTVLDSQHKNAARGVGERNDGLQRAVRGREIALELQCLAFRSTKEGNQVHDSAFYSEARL